LLKFFISVIWCSGNLSFTALFVGWARLFVASAAWPNPAFKRDCRKARQPLNFTLGAMRIMQIFSVSPVAVFAAGSVASSGVVASSVVRSSLLRLLFRYASAVFSCGSFSPVCLQCSVARLASNFTLKRDAAKARRPLAPRWASKISEGIHEVQI
jgi:hypothetical protein